jgi:RNA polymerase sigma-70 factor (ECF subfamily)
MPSASSPLHRDISALYAGHHSWLQGWLRRKLGNACDAADLAQDTFVRLLAAPAGDLPALREPRAYLATVARRLLINHLRRQSLEQAWLQALAALPEPQAPSPEQQLLILQALQEVDAMSQVEGLTYAAIAEQLGMGLRSVKRYMAQAMAECILLSA